MSNEKTLQFLRIEITNLGEEIDEVCAEKSTKRTVYEDLLIQVDQLANKHAVATQKYIDSLKDADEVVVKCAEINKDTKNLRKLARKLKQHEPDHVTNNPGKHTVTADKSVKMPTLPLPEFDGDVLKFRSYWDQFKCAVHDKDHLPDVQKFQYLRGTLKSQKALAVCAGIDTTDANYLMVVDRLLHRFGRKRVIVFAIMKDLIAMKLEGNTTKELRDFYDVLVSRIRSLESLQIDTKEFNVSILLVPILEMKLRPDLLLDWEKEITDMADHKITVDFYINYVEKQITAKEAMERALGHVNSDVVNYDIETENYGSSAAALVANTGDQTSLMQPFKAQGTNALVGNNGTFRPRNPGIISSRPQNTGPRFQNQYQPRNLNTRQPRPPLRMPGLVRPPRMSGYQWCVFCQYQHDVSECQQLTSLPLNDRWRWASEAKLCYNCLFPGSNSHYAANCRRQHCSVEGCGKNHHRVLHYVDTSAYFGHSTETNAVETVVKKSVLETGVAILKSGSSREGTKVRILFDTGSEKSYIRKSLVEAFHLSRVGPAESLTVTTLGAKSTTHTMLHVEAELVSRHDPNQRITIEALAMDRICGPLEPMSLESLGHLEGLPLADEYPRGKSTVDILIGQNYYYDIIHGGKCKRGPVGSPIALYSSFGWVLGGSMTTWTSRQGAQAMLATNQVDAGLTLPEVVTVSNEEVKASMTRFWDLESIGISRSQDSSTTLERDNKERSVKDFFSETVQFNGKQYIVRIPWKTEVVDMRRNNYGQALKCLQSMEKHLFRNPKKMEAYQAAINRYELDGISELVPDAEHNPTGQFVNYFSHHAVCRESKITTKTRIVMNGALRGPDGLSLNDLILPGPSLQPNLAAVLLRFRNSRVGLIADISKMFLQVQLDPRDRDSHRYLWRNLDTSVPPKIYRMNRVTFGVNCSPFLAIATVQHHARVQENVFPDAADEVTRNMYVDDLVTGRNTIVEAKSLVQNLRALMSSGGFHLTKWASNSKEVLDSIPQEDCFTGVVSNAGESDTLKVLGLVWNLEKDSLRSDVVDIVEETDDGTMRGTVSMIAKFYDPLGLYGPFTITAKILLQTMWIHHSKWHDTLDECCKAAWEKWKLQLPQLIEEGVPRCVVENGDISSIELHGFSDASPTAYGCGVWIRIAYQNGEVSCNLIMAKSRVAPLKRQSLPRLELLGAVMGAQLMKFVHESLQLKIDGVYLWTDSLITYHWLMKSPQQLKEFVGNRVQQATELWPASTWRYCPGELNPSDLLTRGITAAELKKSDLWWHGPPWLRMSKTEWPKTPSSKSQSESLPEVKCETTALAASTSVQKEIKSETAHYSSQIIDPTRHSTWQKLLRVTAYVFRAITRFRQKDRLEIELKLDLEEVTTAERYWLKQVQSQHFPETLMRLNTSSNKNGKIVDNLLRLDPYMDENTGILRVGGRLQNSNLPDVSKHQIILPSYDWITRLVILHVHGQACHVGPENTHCIARQKYWVVHGRKEIQRILKLCPVCKLHPRKPETQKMAPLPKERVTPEFAFSTVGVDFAGPLYLRYDTKNCRITVKSYICLFTCATSRMIHLELCQSMSTSEFIMAFRRMTNRRGVCHTVISDNALTFKASSKILRPRPIVEVEPSLDEEQLNRYFTNEGIQWKFICDRSPWQGGFYERMVRSVKISLRRVLGRALLTYCEMNTVLTDIEASLNSRPLTVVSSDNRDPEPLTPAHLAIGRTLRVLPDDKARTLLKEEASRRYIYIARTLEAYWRRWIQEYLPLLTVRKTWTVESPLAKVGNVVLVSDDRTPRGQWPMAVITKVMPGQDGLVRNVQIRTAKNQILTRPVQRLYLIEEAAAEAAIESASENHISLKN